jgi:hypothetical protein
MMMMAKIAEPIRIDSFDNLESEYSSDGFTARDRD